MERSQHQQSHNPREEGSSGAEGGSVDNKRASNHQKKKKKPTAPPWCVRCSARVWGAPAAVMHERCSEVLSSCALQAQQALQLADRDCGSIFGAVGGWRAQKAGCAVCAGQHTCAAR
eukprot:1159212-Pelagomonas_calceolata.AAC.2